MNDLNNKIVQSSFTGIVEVFVSHPIEYMKTHIQCGKSMKTLKIYPKLYFNSMYPRFVTIIPMRTIFGHRIIIIKILILISCGVLFLLHCFKQYLIILVNKLKQNK